MLDTLKIDHSIFSLNCFMNIFYDFLWQLRYLLWKLCNNKKTSRVGGSFRVGRVMPIQLFGALDIVWYRHNIGIIVPKCGSGNAPFEKSQHSAVSNIQCNLYDPEHFMFCGALPWWQFCSWEVYKCPGAIIPFHNQILEKTHLCLNAM